MAVWRLYRSFFLLYTSYLSIYLYLPGYLIGLYHFFQAVYSNGFTVIRNNPVGDNLNIINPNNTESPISNIQFNWTSFDQPALRTAGILDRLESSPISYYEWTVIVDYQGSRPDEQILSWQFVNVTSSVDQVCQYNYIYDPSSSLLAT